MRKKLLITILVVLIISISTVLTIFYLNRYNLVCTRELVLEKQNFNISFNFFGNLKNQVLERILYFETNEEAKEYYNDLIKNYNIEKDNIMIEDKIITIYEYDVGIIQDDVSKEKIKSVKKIYKEHGFTCKEVKK